LEWQDVGTVVLCRDELEVDYAQTFVPAEHHRCRMTFVPEEGEE
jgi:hypothetical protein